MEQLAELEEVERRHRFEDIDLVIEQFPDFHHALEPVHDHVHVRAVVVRGRLAQDFLAGGDLVQDLLKPELVGLVDDDEEHLIVRDHFPVAQTERLLQFEEPRNPEVVAVILRRALVIDRAFHRGSLAHRGGRSQCAAAPAPGGDG